MNIFRVVESICMLEGKNTAIKQKIKRNIDRNKEKMEMSDFEPTDASFEDQLIYHCGMITGNMFRQPEHYHKYAHILWKYASVVRAVFVKIALGAIRNYRCVTAYIVRTPHPYYMHKHYRNSWKQFFYVRLTPDVRVLCEPTLRKECINLLHNYCLINADQICVHTGRGVFGGIVLFQWLVWLLWKEWQQRSAHRSFYTQLFTPHVRTSYVTCKNETPYQRNSYATATHYTPHIRHAYALVRRSLKPIRNQIRQRYVRETSHIRRVRRRT